MRTFMRDHDELGQVLPIAALFMTVLLLIGALAIDVSSVLASERFYTTTADAAALAGAQDLQKNKTRAVTPPERTRARTHSMAILVDELGASATPSGGACAATSDIADCALPGTPYLVSIQTPAPYCDQCDADYAVKVTIRHLGFELTFARLVGQDTWDVEAAAVAGLQFAGKYALIALKPQSNYDPGIVLNGSNTTLDVQTGDIGTNTHLVESSGDVILDSGFYVRHYNDTMKNGKLGFTPASMGKDLGTLIKDPGYQEPVWPDKGTNPELFYDGQNDANASTPCDEVASLPSVVQDHIDDGDDVTCFKPGVYEPGKGNLKQFTVGSSEVAYLLPGAYLFEGGMDVNGYIYGGLVPTERGVVLSIPNDQEIDMESAEAIVLNTGTTQPAVDFDSPENEVDTVPGADPGLIITFYVPRDEACFSGDRTPLECSAKNATVKLAGTSAMNISGVIYAPSETIAIRGNSSSNSIDGQIVGWTLEWSGGSTLNLNYPDFEQVGTLRLDAACTGVERCS